MTAAALRFLADENCDFAVVRALRAAGFDVLAVAEHGCGTDDRELLARASRERRVVLTEDKDFGWLVFVSEDDSSGVILIRFPAGARAALVAAVCDLVHDHADALPGAFAVVEPGRVRLTRRPI